MMMTITVVSREYMDVGWMLRT